MRHPLLVLSALLAGLLLSPLALGASVTNIAQADFPVNAPTPLPIYHYVSGGSPAAVHFTTSGTSITSDSGTVQYPEASVYGAGSSSVQYCATPLCYGLVGYWPLQEGSGSSAYDLTHNNQTGLLVGSPSWTSSNCKVAPCLALNGAGQYLDTTYYFPTGSSAISEWVWFTPANVATNGYGGIIGTRYTDGAAGCGAFYILQLANSANVEFRVQNSAGTNWGYDSTNSPLSLNVPALLELTWDGTTGRAYINGALVSSGAISGTLGGSGCPLWVGDQSIAGSPGNPAVGTVSAAGVASRTLTASEASELYASAVPTLEHKVSSSGNTYPVKYYEQVPETVSSGSVYESFGSLYSATVTGTYWVDGAIPVPQPQVDTWLVAIPLVLAGGFLFMRRRR